AYGISSNESKLSAIEKIRRGIIDEHSAKGYKIYQVSFDPTYYENFMQYKNGNWIPYEYVKRSAISPLWISYYRQGEIRSMIESLGGFEKAESSGLTVESKSKTTATTSEDSEKRKRMMELARFNAGLVESEANRLYDMGTLYYPKALEKYKEANSIFPSAHSQQRIEYIQSLYALGDALNSAGESIDNVVYNI